MRKMYLMGKCIHSKYYFYGVFATDNFPKLTRKGFIVVNASPAQYEGSHWMVILFHESKYYLADPLGIPIQNYQLLYSRLVQFYNEVIKYSNLNQFKIKTQNSVDFFAFILHM